MDPLEILGRIDTVADCEQFATNVREKYPDVAKRAERRAVQLRAKKHGNYSGVEAEGIEPIYAYEAALTKTKGETTRATRTWQMIDRHGIVGAIARAVDRPADASGYKVLKEMGLDDLTFESVVLRHPDQFSESVVERCRDRMKRYESN